MTKPELIVGLSIRVLMIVAFLTILILGVLSLSGHSQDPFSPTIRIRGGDQTQHCAHTISSSNPCQIELIADDYQLKPGKVVVKWAATGVGVRGEIFVNTSDQFQAVLKAYAAGNYVIHVEARQDNDITRSHTIIRAITGE